MKKLSTDNLIILVLLILNIFTAWKFMGANKKIGIYKSMQAGQQQLYKLEHINIPLHTRLLPLNAALDTNLSAELKKNDKTLLILFEPTRCGSCLEEKLLWNELYEKKICPVIAVSAENNRAELETYLEESGTKIPVYQDTSAVLGRWIHPSDVPVKILVNSRHEILYVDYVREGEKERKDFSKILKSLLKQ